MACTVSEPCTQRTGRPFGVCVTATPVPAAVMSPTSGRTRSCLPNPLCLPSAPCQGADASTMSTTVDLLRGDPIHEEDDLEVGEGLQSGKRIL